MSITKKHSYRPWGIFAVLLLISVLCLTVINNWIEQKDNVEVNDSISSETSPEIDFSESESSIAPSSIRQITDESYISEYDLRVIGFLEPEVWAVMDADNRAFILGQTTYNESHRYGISPRIHVDVADLGWSLKNENVKMDDIFLFECDKYAFGWQPDEYFPSITIDRKLLENLDPSEALFVCHKALYYAYARYLLDLQDQEKLPERYSNCKEQLTQYREDLALHDEGGSCTNTLLENDAVSFGISCVEYYYGFIIPDDENSFYERQIRRYWRVCLNEFYKKDMLHLLVDEMSEFYTTGVTYRIANSEAALEEYRSQSDQEYAFIQMDDDLLNSGDPLDCIAVLVQAMVPTVAENYFVKSGEELDQQKWCVTASRLAWERLMGILKENGAI